MARNASALPPSDGPAVDRRAPASVAAWSGWDPWSFWSRTTLDLDIRAASAGSPQAVADRQRGRLARLLAAARDGSSFWRQRLSGHDPGTMPLEALPAVGKATLMRHFDASVTDPALTLDGLRHFVADPARIGEPFLGRYTVWESSGSSGVPGLFVQDDAALTVYDALEADRRVSADPLARWLDPCFLRERIAFVGALDGHFASHVSVRRLQRLTPWLTRGWRSFSILQPLPGLCAALDDFQPTILASYPTAATLLAAEQAAGRLHIAPTEVWTGGETLSHGARANIEQAFGTVVRNSYGASEFLPIAWECAHGALHVNADWVILEPVDARHHPVPPGTQSHTTLLTNLANHVQPLIRYDLGDRSSWRAEPCRCGSPLPAIDVLGRCDDVLRLPGRDGRTVTLLPLAVSTVLEDEAGVFDFLLEQTGRSTLRLRVAGRSAGDARRRAGGRAADALRTFAARQGVVGLRLKLETPEHLPQALRGRSGKLKRITVR